MAKKLSTAKKKIDQAIEAGQELFWQRRGRETLQLKAVTYTWENGKERVKCLMLFDLREELQAVLEIHRQYGEKIMLLNDALEGAYWDKVIDRYPSILLEASHASV